MLGPDLGDGALLRFPGWVTLERLGEGGMCVVYRVRSEADGVERAAKVLVDRSSSAIRRFVDEAKLLQRIDHPNVVKVHGVATDERPPWIVMDLLGGRDLEETMRVEGPMDPERAALLFADLSSGLAAVHAAGVRHRDLKPANVRLGSDGVARLIDFGIARDATAERVTRAGMVVGTASYLPPEIFVEEDASRVQDTEAADVYALGQTLCEVLTGKPVHGGGEGAEAALLVRIMRDKLDRAYLDPRDFGARAPEGLCEVVRHATRREPSDRLSTAAALEAELRRWLRERGSAAEVAPLTRLDPSVLPVPGRSRAPDPSPPAPSVAPPAGPSTPPVAETSPSRAGAVATTAAVGAAGAMGLAGVGLLAVGLLLCLALLGGAAWLLSTTGDEARLSAEVEARAEDLARCRPGPEAKQVVLVLTVRDHRTASVVVKADQGGRASRCVERVLDRVTWTVEGPVTVEVPVHFR